ncbi:MAG: DUF2203 family protein [Planctomycetes bacterium]|nr:DUF2203 family protein [Planctomycetota bacterium]
MTTTATDARYSLEEANRLLPLLESIATEIRERRDEQRRLARLRDELESSRTPEGLDKSLAELDARLMELQLGLREALGELEALGVSILRLKPLTVHIPGRTQHGDIVYCWQVGEGRITHGHLIGEEDDPRRPLQLRPQPDASA